MYVPKLFSDPETQRRSIERQAREKAADRLGKLVVDMLNKGEIDRPYQERLEIHQLALDAQAPRP